MSENKQRNTRAPRKKIILPRLQLTRVVDEHHPNAIAICHEGHEPYYVAPLTHDDPEGYGILPAWTHFEFPAFPVPLDPDGAPWEPGVIYILKRIEEAPYPDMATYSNSADDVASFGHFLAEGKFDWWNFPKHKLLRPTYRYQGYLIALKGQKKIGQRLAARRMGTVVAMYRCLQNEGVFSPEFPAWIERARLIPYTTKTGFPGSVKVTTTDVSVPAAKSEDDDYIYDGEKMRPLELDEQDWLFRGLRLCGNSTIILMHLYTIASGARLQTVLTTRVGHVRQNLQPDSYGNVHILAGPGTGIDTKGNRVGKLHVPMWLFEALKVYAESPEAQRRRLLNGNGDGDDQFLFLTHKGAPFYNTKDTSHAPGLVAAKRYLNRGNGVQQYIREYVIPAVRTISGDQNFRYVFHWLRATFAMNLLDAQLVLVNSGEITLLEALEHVRERMWHKDISVTMGYLNFRGRKEKRRAVQSAFEEHLKRLAALAMNGGE